MMSGTKRSAAQASAAASHLWVLKPPVPFVSGVGFLALPLTPTWSSQAPAGPWPQLAEPRPASCFLLPCLPSCQPPPRLPTCFIWPPWLLRMLKLAGTPRPLRPEHNSTLQPPPPSSASLLRAPGCPALHGDLPNGLASRQTRILTSLTPTSHS